MAVIFPKGSPSLADLTGNSREKIERHLYPKKKYLVTVEDTAAHQRRGETEYESFVCKITSVLLESFVKYIRKKTCLKKEIIDKNEFGNESDVSKISLVSPAPSITVTDGGLSIYSSSESGVEKKIAEKTEISEFEEQSKNSKINMDEYKESEEGENKSEIKTESNTTASDIPKSVKSVPETSLKERKSFKLDKSNVQPSKQSRSLSDSDLIDVNIDLMFKNGNGYHGRLSYYLMEGEATYTWSDGTIYKGTFIDGMREGLGLIKWKDGSWYDGEIKSNCRHGRGISLLKKDGVPKMCYYGNWHSGKANGKGMVIYGENNWYDGYWKKGKCCGFGLRQYPSGSRYLGEWQNGLEHGWGTMVWSNRDVYTGYWVNGKMEGKGTYAWQCVKSDSFVHPMQNTFLGHWKNGKQHGSGSLLLNSGVVIHAVWAKGVKDGPGQILCRNGFVIESSSLFKDDKVYKLDTPVKVPFWNTWYHEFLSSYRSGLYAIQLIKDDVLECERKKRRAIITHEKYNQCSNNIPIFAPVESLPLWDFVLKAVCQPIPNLYGEISYYIRTEDIETLNFEEMWLRKVISNRMADINCLYQHYSTLACEKKPEFKTSMFKIMLWQMCRDCGSEKTRFNLCELDQEVGVDSYPFAIVLLFQMIHYLLILAYELCVRERKANPSIPGKWGGAFDYFLTNYALPGMQKPSHIPELCNTIPLKNLFCLYEYIGMPVTLGKLFNHFTYDNNCNWEEMENKPKIKFCEKLCGQNKVYPDGRIVFEEPDGSLLGTVFEFDRNDSKYFDVNDIRLLGKRELASIIFEICPKAKKDEIPNREFEISFLEFCEFIKTSIKKFDSLIDPSTDVTIVSSMAKCKFCNDYVEVERHYEIEHKNDEEQKSSSEFFEKNIEREKSECFLPSKEKDMLNGSQKISSSSSDSRDGSEDIANQSATLPPIACSKNCDCLGSCNCLKKKFPDFNDSDSYEIIDVNDDFTASRSTIATNVPFKDAKTITLIACESDCTCFCHEKNEHINDEEKENLSEENDSDFTTVAEESLEVEADESSASTVNLSDAIDYLCEKKSKEGLVDEAEVEDESEISSEGESSSEWSESIGSEWENEMESEALEEEDDLLAGESLVVKTKELLSELEKIGNSKGGRIESVFEKLLKFNPPQFKIKFNNIFKNVSAKGMSPQELRDKLELDEEHPLESQSLEDIEKELVNESLKVINAVAKQRLYEKLLMGQFKKTIAQIETGEYWENFVEYTECNCSCKKCLDGQCVKSKKKTKFTVGDDEYEFSSDSSVSID